MPDVGRPSQAQNACMTSVLGPTKTLGASSLTIRRARHEDLVALATLAQLDSSRMPTGRVLVAEVGDELWAAISVEDLHAGADPFRPSGELVFLLVERARQMRRDEDRRPGRRRLRRPAFA